LGPPQYYLRNTAIRRALAPAHIQKGLRDEHPDIFAFSEGRSHVVQTEGVGIVDASSDPCGVVFTDGSFLVIREKWSKVDDELLAYSYHYQRRGGAHVRFDMDEEEKAGIPKHHVQFSGLRGARSQDVHAPSGEVTIEQVLDMIVREFF
jgi:hypothetical protein